MTTGIRFVNRKQALKIAIENIIKCNHKIRNKIEDKDYFNIDDINKVIQPDNNLAIIKSSKASGFKIIPHDVYGMHITPIFKKKNKDIAKIWKKMLNQLNTGK